jgi:hypothetical protein
MSFFKRVTYYEPLIDKRFKAAQEKAGRVFNNQLNETDDEGDILRFYLATQLGIGVFDKYLTDRTFDELVYEIELYRLRSLPRDTRTSELINQNKDELGSMFDDWAEQDMQEVLGNNQDDTFMDDARAFMETGEFKE